jgi:hypothetical protein
MDFIVSTIEFISSSPTMRAASMVLGLLGINLISMVGFLIRRNSKTDKPRPSEQDKKIEMAPIITRATVIRPLFHFVVLDAEDVPRDPAPGIVPVTILPSIAMCFGFLIWVAVLPGYWGVLGVVLVAALTYGGIRLGYIFAEMNFVVLDTKRHAVYVFNRGIIGRIKKATVVYQAEQTGLLEWQSRVGIQIDQATYFSVRDGETHSDKTGAWNEGKPFAEDLASLVGAQVVQGTYEWREWKKRAEGFRSRFRWGRT